MIEDHFPDELKLLLDEERMKRTYKQVVDRVLHFYETKSKDYNSDGVRFTDYFPEGCRDLFLAVHGKALRLRSLVGRNGPVQEPNHESISDNALDLAAYAVWMSVLSR